jgi:hypothetical protein
MNIIFPRGNIALLGEHYVLLGAIHTEDLDMRLAGVEKGGLWGLLRF